MVVVDAIGRHFVDCAKCDDFYEKAVDGTTHGPADADEEQLAANKKLATVFDMAEPPATQGEIRNAKTIILKKYKALSTASTDESKTLLAWLVSEAIRRGIPLN